MTVPALYPEFKLKFFVPFLILVYYQTPLFTSLLCSILCGLVLDLLSAAKFGTYAVAYCLTTSLLYSQRFNFFSDNIMTLPIMTLAFSLLSTLLEAVLHFAFGQSIVLSWHWGLSELVILPFADALYSFILFILPFYRSQHGRRA